MGICIFGKWKFVTLSSKPRSPSLFKSGIGPLRHCIYWEQDVHFRKIWNHKYKTSGKNVDITYRSIVWVTGSFSDWTKVVLNSIGMATNHRALMKPQIKVEAASSGGRLTRFRKQEAQSTDLHPQKKPFWNSEEQNLGSERRKDHPPHFTPKFQNLKCTPPLKKLTHMVLQIPEQSKTKKTSKSNETPSFVPHRKLDSASNRHRSPPSTFSCNFPQPTDFPKNYLSQHSQNISRTPPLPWCIDGCVDVLMCQCWWWGWCVGLEKK